MVKDKEYKAAVAVGKQKNLFSFFSKQPKKAGNKPPSATSEAGAAPSAGTKQAGGSANDGTAAAEAEAPPSAKVRRGNSAARAKDLSKICVGTKLAVFWPGEFWRLPKTCCTPPPVLHAPC